MGRLSTHVLDTARGVPAEGVRIDLHRLMPDGLVHVKTVVTNADGRTEEPLLHDAETRAGTYELTFHAGEYFRRMGIALSEPPFLDEVVVRFGLSNPQRNCHVPVLLSPYGYSTYRGS